MLPIIFLKSVGFLFLVMYQFYSGFLSYSFPAYHCLFIEHLVRVRRCSKCFIVCITSFDPQGISITIPILLTRNLRPRVTCRRAGFWTLVFWRTHYQPLAVLVTLQSAISYSLLKSLIDLLIEKHIRILLTSLVGFLSTLEVRLII